MRKLFFISINGTISLTKGISTFFDFVKVPQQVNYFFHFQD